METKIYGYILDYAYGGLYEVEIPEELYDAEVEEILSYYGLNVDSCYLMITDHKLKLETLTKN